jgi:xanthine dehydrogenase accessory factor
VDVFERISELLSNGESFVLATVVRRSGSAPRTIGARMVIRRDDSIIGTIGGGVLEAMAQKLAKMVFENKTSILRKFGLTPDDADRIGMICGGQVEVLVHFVEASALSNVQFYREILETLSSGQRKWLITELPSEGGDGSLQQCLVGNGGTSGCPIDGGTIRELIDLVGAKTAGVVEHREKKYLVECLCRAGNVYIFGAGHISQKLAPLARSVGFRTIVLDDRHDFANRERFETADQVIVVESFDRAFEGIEINRDGYLVLVTRGHVHDKTVLRQALRTSAGYIGMIGSKKKRDTIYEELLGEGFSRSDFERVYSPVGLEIGAETPEEIAVSIVAELIQARAARNS